MLLKSLEYNLLKDYYASTKNRLLYSTRYVFFFVIASIFCNLTFSIFNKIGFQATLISLLYTALFLIPSFIYIKSSKKEQEFTQTRLKEYRVINDEFIKNISSRLLSIIQVSLLLTIILLAPVVITLTLGYNNNKKLFLLFPLVLLSIFILFFIFFYAKYYRNKPRPELLNIEPFKGDNNTKLSVLLAPVCTTALLASIFTLAFTRKILPPILTFFISAGVLAVFFHIFIKKHHLYNRSTRDLFVRKIIKTLIDVPGKWIRNKKLSFFYMKYYPMINATVLFLILSITLSGRFRFNITTIISFAMIGGLIFSSRCFLSFNKYGKESRRPFVFARMTALLYIVFLFLSFLNFVPVLKEGAFLYSFKDIILPITNLAGNVFGIFKGILTSNNLLKIVLPVPLFIAVYGAAFYVQKIIHFAEKYADKRLKKEISGHNQAMIFGDSLSLYPFVYKAILSGFTITILYVELPFLSSLITNLIKTLQVAEVFKIKFITPENIAASFHTIFYISVLYVVFKLLIDFIKATFSHFMLFSDEVVMVENTLINRKIVRLPVVKINNISVHQNIIERMLDIGTIFIETSENGMNLAVKGITSVNEKSKKIMDKVKIGLQKIK